MRGLEKPVLGSRLVSGVLSLWEACGNQDMSLGPGQKSSSPGPLLGRPQAGRWTSWRWLSVQAPRVPWARDPKVSQMSPEWEWLSGGHLSQCPASSLQCTSTTQTCVFPPDLWQGACAAPQCPTLSSLNNRVPTFVDACELWGPLQHEACRQPESRGALHSCPAQNCPPKVTFLLLNPPSTPC